MSVLSTHINMSSNINLLDLDDDALELIFAKLLILDLITLLQTCKRFYSIISKLPVFKNNIEEFKKIIDEKTFIFNLEPIEPMDYDWDDWYHGLDDNQRNEPCDEEAFLLDFGNIVYSRFIHMSTQYIFDNITEINLMYDWGEDLSCLIRCRMLTELNVEECSGLTDASYLVHNKMLSKLKFINCINLTEASFNLSQCKNLTSIDLTGCIKVTNLYFLDQCKMLTRLDLSRCTGLTDVSCLSQCKMLTELNLEDCTNLTQENVDSLKEELPHCNIYWL